jgi:hypothetical protein
MSIQQRSRISLLVLFAVLAGLIGLTLKPLTSQVRFGLEFRGG